MKVQIGAVIAVLMLSAGAASAITPAWQKTGFVMEEVIVTANANDVATASAVSVITPAWQEPGFVMEEVIVTANAKDVATAALERLHRRARLLIAARLRGDLA